MRAPIAKIRINAGNPGWYDPLTNIHLTITRPEAFVYEGSNTTNIRRSVSHGLVHILEGSLEEEKATREVASKEETVKEVREVVPQVKDKTEEVVTANVIPTEEIQEDVQEVIEVAEEVAEVVEEKPKAKKTTRKKAAKKEKDAE